MKMRCRSISSQQEAFVTDEQTRRVRRDRYAEAIEQLAVSLEAQLHARLNHALRTHPPAAPQGLRRVLQHLNAVEPALTVFPYRMVVDAYHRVLSGVDDRKHASVAHMVAATLLEVWHSP